LKDAPARGGLAGLAFVGSIILARLVASTVEPLERPAPWQDDLHLVKRVEQMRAALPTIGAAEHPIVVYGSSLTALGFSPERFDAALARRGWHATTFNLGQPAIPIFLEKVLHQRVAEQLSRAGREATALVELTPGQLTTPWTGPERWTPDFSQEIVLLGRPNDVLRLALQSTDRTDEIVSALAFRGHMAWKTTQILDRRLFGEAPLWWPRSAVDVPAERGSAEEQLAVALMRHCGGPCPDWDPQLRGERRLAFPDTEAEVRRLNGITMTPEQKEGDLRGNVRIDDALELHLDERLVSRFVALLAEMRQSYAHTMAFVTPMDRGLVRRTPDAEERVRVLLDRVRREAGVEVLDFSSDPDFGAIDFRDSTHLDELSGKPKFSAKLADVVADRIGASVAR
jgi:hypothetical protein